MRRPFAQALYGLGFLVLLAAPAAAQTRPASPAPSASPGASAAPAAARPAAGGDVAYDTWTKDAQKQTGLFTLWRKDGRAYIELRTDQFAKDFLQTAVPANGLGGYRILSGDVFQQEARIVRFERDGRRVAVVWPQTRFLAKPDTPLADAVRLSTADSVSGMAPIVTEDKKAGLVVLDLGWLLGDVMNLTDSLNGSLADPRNPATAFRLDPARTYFGPSKAFPTNVMIEADQTYTSSKPADNVNTVVDSRSLQMRLAYNFAALPDNNGYVPRLADDRVGYFEDPHIRFGRDHAVDNYERYIMRWNVQPSDPSKPISPAKTPIVYTISNSVPVEYRTPIRDAILAWNKAFEKIGISDVVRVQDQPADPAWDPDDFRYNVVRWLTQENGGGFAEAQPVWDPRTGQILRAGVLIDNDLIRLENKILDSDGVNGAGAHQEMQYGAVALSLMAGATPEAVAQGLTRDFVYSITLHEIGHNFGLQHNFIAYQAYSKKQIRDKNFTAQFGIAASVMAYNPINLAPKGVSNGALMQLVLGPYDYHAIHWGYARIPGATTPDEEVSTLNKWASVWSDPRFRFASDEDVSWGGSHAIDPRVNQFLLTNDPLGWCDEQLGIIHGLFAGLDQRLPQAGRPYADEQFAFGLLLRQYGRCASSATHYIGGEYLSRAHRGDPGAAPPLTAVSRQDEQRAYAMLDRYVFSNGAWRFSPQTLRRLVYTEHSAFTNFGYSPVPRHDLSVADAAWRVQSGALSSMFNPLVLSRIADLPDKAAAGKTMTLADLFTWSQNAIFGDVSTDAVRDATQVRRNLQRRYTLMLASLATAPPPGTPYDAQALARYELTLLDARIGTALRKSLDLQTRAHLEAMRVDVHHALNVQAVTGRS